MLDIEATAICDKCSEGKKHYFVVSLGDSGKFCLDHLKEEFKIMAKILLIAVMKRILRF